MYKFITTRNERESMNPYAQRRKWCRYLVSCMFGLSWLAMLPSGALGQEVEVAAPAPDAEAVATDEFEVPAMERREIGPGSGGPARYMIRDVYYSPNLRGHFRAQWMYIIQNGRQVNFWGARIVHLDFDSPLRQIGVSSGDVITRLDGVPVWKRMYRESRGPWQLVQMEQHYGRTEVRYILRGTHQVRIGDMMLDGYVPDGFNDANPIPP